MAATPEACCCLSGCGEAIHSLLPPTSYYGSRLPKVKGTSRVAEEETGKKRKS